LKAHAKLGPKKEYVKERMELHDAIMTLSSLLESGDKESE
jgi:hypothetical protein